nr:YodL domain-containing protein [[Clostridium] innocuum]
MRFSIYQLNEKAPRMFSFNEYEKIQSSISIAELPYDKVYDAELTEDMSLEDIFRIFNIDHPDDFKGHSLSVSDIVVLEQSGKKTAYYVEPIGFRDITNEFLCSRKLMDKAVDEITTLYEEDDESLEESEEMERE